MNLHLQKTYSRIKGAGNYKHTNLVVGWISVAHPPMSDAMVDALRLSTLRPPHINGTLVISTSLRGLRVLIDSDVAQMNCHSGLSYIFHICE